MSYFLRWLGKRWGGGPKLMSASDRDALLADMCAAIPDVLMTDPFNWNQPDVGVFLNDWLESIEGRDLSSDLGQAQAELALIGLSLATRKSWSAEREAIFVNAWLDATEAQSALTR